MLTIKEWSVVFLLRCVCVATKTHDSSTQRVMVQQWLEGEDRTWISIPIPQRICYEAPFTFGPLHPLSQVRRSSIFLFFLWKGFLYNFLHRPSLVHLRLNPPRKRLLSEFYIALLPPNVTRSPKSCCLLNRQTSVRC